MDRNTKYDIESKRVAKAAEIAIETYKKFYKSLSWTTENLRFSLEIHNMIIEGALNPKPGFKNMASLKQNINMIMIYFQEGSGESVDYFWKRIKEENLGFIRKDKLALILKRGKIRGTFEYDFLKDMVVALLQEKRITDEEFEKLCIMIEEFEHVKK